MHFIYINDIIFKLKALPTAMLPYVYTLQEAMNSSSYET